MCLDLVVTLFGLQLQSTGRGKKMLGSGKVVAFPQLVGVFMCGIFLSK